MEIVNFDQLKNELLLIMEKQQLIPVLGAGFTKDEKTEENEQVPDAQKFQEIMILEIIKHTDYTTLEEGIKKLSFNEVSHYFFNDEIVERATRNTILKKYFLNIKLPEIKKNILNKTAWPYIYTFNIDNAIEKNSSFNTILPYKLLNDEARNAGCVYKVHGDVWHEITYDEESTLIFSEKQYLQSLIKNQSILTYLKTDFIENNLLFIGCSLDKEIDLMFAISGNEKPFNPNSKRILVTRTKPTNKLEEDKYKKYGINTILLIEDYNKFYQDIYLLSLAVQAKEKSNLFKAYKVSELEKIPLNDIKKNLEQLLKIQGKYLLHNNQLIKAHYVIDREITYQVQESIEKNPITIITGKRFSGKSSLAINLFEKNKTKDFFYIPSTIKIDKDKLELFLLTGANLILFIDSNVLDQDVALLIKNKIKKLEEQKISIVIACNNMELDISNTFVFLPYNDYSFELKNRFSELEINDLNKKLSDIGIVNFIPNKTLLDNIYFMYDRYPEYRKNISDLSVNITDEEAQLIIILSVFEKVYLPVCVALGIQRIGLHTIIDKFAPIFELEETDMYEREQHSRFKIVVNSAIWLRKLIKDFHHRSKRDDILKNVKKIIAIFKNHGQYKIIQQRVMMFDALNEIAGKEDGSYNLLLYLYENLAEQLSDIPDYWLQRAKAVYKLERKDCRKIEDAIKYAKKAYEDATRTKTVTNAEFMIALLYGKLCFMEEYRKIENILEAIEWFSKAISNHSGTNNRDYVDSMLENKKDQQSKSIFLHFCEYLNIGNKEPKILEKKAEVQEILGYAHKKV